ncbi:MAG: cysteine desulfurase [Clostridiales bacterium]|nr:cysteine desulfurase [Clostridiales bacterium]
MFVYLDNSSTTRQYDEVTDEMIKFMKDDFGNPSSLHRMGMIAENAVSKARKTIASSIGAKEEEIFFTGSGTEADNTAIFGAAQARRRRGKKIITSKIEHPAVIEACKKLETMGFLVEYIGVDNKGLVDLEELEHKIDDNTILVSIMYVNNELGTVQPLEKIAKLFKGKNNILFHTDAVQAFGKIPFTVDDIAVDLLSLSGHKIHGPKGTGGLYIRKGVNIDPFLYGGGQEKGFRSGTENTPGLIGFGLAAEIMHRNTKDRIEKIKQARNYLLNGIKDEIESIRINSPIELYGESNSLHVCSPAILNVSFLGCRGEVLLHFLEEQGIYVSTGAACSSKKKGNRVLSAVGMTEEEIDSAIRFSFSEFNTIEQMDYVLEKLKDAVNRMRNLRYRR